MRTNELKAIMLLMCVCLLAVCVYPVSAVTYSPGVSQGHYVKYGNFVLTDDGEDENLVDWFLIEVMAVSGQVVTLRTSGQYKNGTALPIDNTIIYNIENGTMTQDNMTSYYSYGPIIAANLSEGDLIPPISYGLMVNKTEIRIYLNESRGVNILNTTYLGDDIASKRTIVYDKATGMMLEYLFEQTEIEVPPETMNYSYSVIETNIYTAIEGPFYSQTWFLIAEAVIGAVVIAGVALWMRRR